MEGTVEVLGLQLSEPPTGNVRLTFPSVPDFNFNPLTMTFTPADWNLKQTLQLRIVDNNMIEGYKSGQINFTVAFQSTDQNYSGFPNALPYTIADNDLQYESFAPNFGFSGGDTVATVTFAQHLTLSSTQASAISCQFGQAGSLLQNATTVGTRTLECKSSPCTPNPDPSIGCTSPVDLIIVYNGQQSSVNQPFSYRTLPRLSQVRPANGLIHKDTVITIIGQDFINVSSTTVTVGGAAIDDLVIINSVLILVHLTQPPFASALFFCLAHGLAHGHGMCIHCFCDTHAREINAYELDAHERHGAG